MGSMAQVHIIGESQDAAAPLPSYDSNSISHRARDEKREKFLSGGSGLQKVFYFPLVSGSPTTTVTMPDGLMRLWKAWVTWEMVTFDTAFT